MRTRVSSLLCSILRVTAFTVALCVGRGFALQTQAPQTPQQSEARDALNQGVQAYKNGQYDEATRLFEHAKNLDPNLLNARLYLATTYASLFVPGVGSEENRAKGRRAIEEFRSVLEKDPQNLSAIDGIGSLLYQMAGLFLSSSEPNPGPVFDEKLAMESKSFHEQHINLRPQDPEPYYWIGVIDWTLAYRANLELRQSYNNGRNRSLGPVDPLPTSSREQFVQQYSPTIDEGIEHLKRAIALKPDYADAMAYLNLLYRQKADTAANASERKEFLNTADQLVDQVKEIKQRRAQAQPQ
jgi:tetratricopeptide (TPR) repeat protein